MTQVEWLTTGDPLTMTEFVRTTATERQLRLFASTVCGGVPLVERYLNDKATLEEMVSASEDAVRGLASHEEICRESARRISCGRNIVRAVPAVLRLVLEADDHAATDNTRIYADAARRVFGNPFRSTNNQFRLFACGCVRGVEERLSTDKGTTDRYFKPGRLWSQVLDVAEGFGCGKASAEEMTSLGRKLTGLYSGMTLYGGSAHETEAGIEGMLIQNRFTQADAIEVADWCAGKSAEAETTQAAILRDIFGNPFRTAPLDPVWLTSTVVALAEGIYADRAFDRMPILADALQDAGCDNDDILNHCRQPGEHVRGCWVVDLVLGKV